MTGLGPFWLDPDDHHSSFPDVELALREPNGLLAVGGDLSPERLLSAYRQGIFPWFSEGQPILWWSPDPRSVLVPERIRVSRSLRRTLAHHPLRITMDHAFSRVVDACAQPRRDSRGTWITDDMFNAYCRLHQMGYAHSVEAWHKGELVGGLYGVALGKIFFGESMFHTMTDASKVAFVHLARQLQQWNFVLIDCQVQTSHLDSLGAEAMPRARFIQTLRRCCELANPGPWTMTLHPTGEDTS